MKRATTGAIFFGSLLLASCGYPIRMVAVLETEDAIYGETRIEKAQKYDPYRNQQDDGIGFFEALVGIFNSDSAKAIRENPTPVPAPVLP